MELEELLSLLNECFPHGDWVIELIFTDSKQIKEIIDKDEDVPGCMVCDDAYERATIYISKDYKYPHWDCEENTLVHEYMHLMTRQMERYTTQHFKSSNNDFYDLIIEKTMEKLAVGIVNMLKSQNKI